VGEGVLFWDVILIALLVVYRIWGQPVVPVFKGQRTQEDGSDRLSRKFGKQLTNLACNIPEEQRPFAVV
jgi:hypothetical protein